MRIAILETGSPPEPLGQRHPTYSAMMERMLQPMAPDFSFSVYRVIDGELPVVGAADGFLITGSPAGVYEGHPWIAPLEDLIRTAALAQRPTVGICFGHQLMAQAFGGRVVKADAGWGVGVHTYEIGQGPDWMRPAPSRLACVVSHQDQVVDLPPTAQRLGGSAFCPNGVLAYAHAPAISFQMHPEFDHDFAVDLIRIRRHRLGEALASEALASLSPAKSDRQVIARWIANFFLQNR